MRDPDGHRTELLLPGMQIIDIDDEPMMCPVKSNASSNCGAGRAKELGGRGNKFCQCGR